MKVKKDTKKEHKDDLQLGLFKEVLTVIFNIEEKQVRRILDVLTRSEDILDVKTRLVMDHAGPRAVSFLRKAIEYARHEGSTKHEDDTDEFELTKKSDIGDLLSMGKKRDADTQPEPDEEEFAMDNKKAVNECTFKDYLIELMVSDDPMQAKRDIMMAQKKPELYQKSQIKGTMDRSREIQKDKENPNKAEELRVNDTERKLILQKKRLADKQKLQDKRQGKEAESDMDIRGDTGERPAAGMVP